MRCEKCGAPFDAGRNAEIGFRQIDCVEVKIKCPSCNDVYYGIVDRWSREAHAIALLEAQQKKEGQ